MFPLVVLDNGKMDPVQNVLKGLDGNDSILRTVPFNRGARYRSRTMVNCIVWHRDKQVRDGGQFRI